LLISFGREDFRQTDANQTAGKYNLRFAEAVAFEYVVPIEQSPLAAEVLVSLVTKATGAGVGAFTGFVSGTARYCWSLYRQA
jgi:hypothetical protein